jgi:phosphoglycerate dehydrogenase-like enzyme
MPNLKWIHFGSVGVNRVQAKEVLDRNIIVTNSRDTMTGAVAAAALSMMLALARGLHHCWRLREDGNLTRESYDRYFDQTYELEGQVCLIVGYGQIGKRLAASCEALGMRVDIISRSATTRDGVKNGKVYQLSELELAGREADYVVNLLPLTNLTTNVFDRKFFSAMKKSAFFINLGRGESVCEDDLIDALKSGTIGGAGLDVFEKEPLAANSELWKIPEVIITPHIGGLTNRYWERQTKLFAENLERYINGKKLVNVVDMGKCY